MLDGWQIAALGWAVAAAVWMALAAGVPKGKSWHFALALAPFAGFAGVLAGPAWLSGLCALWLQMGAAVLVVVALAWVIGTALGNHGIMDIAYPLAPLAAATAGAAATRPDGWIMAMLAPIVIWAARLSIQTFGHNIGHEREPYASWRRRGGARWVWWSFFQVHLLQAATIWIWCLPLAFALAAPEPRPPWPLLLGLAVWAAGFALQATADGQLAAFKRDPANRGRLLDTGVWSLVRHPNYLGEAVMWWGLFCFGLAHPWGVLGIAGPLFATWFMGYASAAPYKERHMAKTRPEAWAAYCARTPRFLPWPRPRRAGGAA